MNAEYLKLIQFENIKIKEGDGKKVISTNIFIPQVMNITNKHFMYLTGLIKSVETFKEKMGKGWVYRIYYDKMFNEFEESEGKNSTSLNNVYEIDKNNNTPYNTKVKGTFNANKEIIKKYITITNLYLKKLKEEDTYDFVELISFNCPKLRQKKYLGHPATFGSIMRFFAFFDPKVDLCYCVNSSHALSSYLANHLKYFADNNAYDYSNLIGSSKDGYHFTQDGIERFNYIFDSIKVLE